AERLAANARCQYDDLPYWHGEVDVCINSFTLANGAWLGADVSRLARWFPEHALADGGWNCAAEEGPASQRSTRSSFHSTQRPVRNARVREADRRHLAAPGASGRRGVSAHAAIAPPREHRTSRRRLRDRAHPSPPAPLQRA